MDFELMPDPPARRLTSRPSRARGPRRGFDYSLAAVAGRAAVIAVMTGDVLPVAGVDSDARVASQMIMAGLRDMTVSEHDAQSFAFCSSVVQRTRRVQAANCYTVFPECFVGCRLSGFASTERPSNQQKSGNEER